MVDDSIVKKWLVGGIIITIFLLAFLVIWPIIIPIIFGILFAYMFNPLYRKINKLIKNKSLAATILILGIALIILMPTIYYAPVIVKQGFETYRQLQNYNFNQALSPYLNPDVAQAFSININNMIGQIFSTFLNQFSKLFVNFPYLLLQFAVFMFTFFFALRDADELKKYSSSLSPFSEATEEKFMKEFRGVTNAIVFGQVLIGIVQGLAIGAGLFFLGVNNVLILTFISCIVSMIPFLGSGLVWFPVGVFLLATGQTFQGIFLLLYGALFVSSLDNIYRSYILSKQTSLTTPLSFMGVIGGFYLFGIAGLILGPLIISYVLIIVEFYQQGKLNELFKK